MAENSKIEWTDHTFNPWVGCTSVSPACDHCYAERWAKRSGTVHWGGERRRTTDANWRLPIKWNAQAKCDGRRFRVFCASLADVFDNHVPTEWRDDLWRLIEATPHLDWLLLTKRIGNVAHQVWPRWMQAGFPSHVHIGATVVTQAEADRDIPKILAVPARVRFLSIEPMLGGMWIAKYLRPGCVRHGALDSDGKCEVCEGRGIWSLGEQLAEHEKAVTRPGLSWVICGGESGPGARPMHPDWARSLRDQCAASGVPFMFKQWGEWAPAESIDDNDDRNLVRRWMARDGGFHGDTPLYRTGTKAAGRLLDGVTHDGFPS